MSLYQPPKSETTLAILLGASNWPHYPGFQGSPSFSKSAEDFRDYLLDKNGFGLPSDNLCYLFDSHQSSSKIIKEISDFLRERLNQPLEQEQLPQDLIVYYVGHGGFRDVTSEYYLAIRSTQRPDLYITSIPIQSLAKALKEEARHLRRYIILDCCFSASAYQSFQSAPIEVAFQKTKEVLPDLPGAGTALLCSSGPRDPSKAPPGLEHTMFTGALIEVLKHGDKNYLELFSIQDLHNLILHILRNKFNDDTVRPEVHSPEQRLGDISEVRLFPNPSWRRQNKLPELSHDPQDYAGNKEPKSRALLIGVPKYRSKAILSHPFIENDMKQLSEALESSGYQVRSIGIDKHVQATPGLIRGCVYEFCSKAEKDETLLLCFSGRGVHFDGEDYLVPCDALIEDPNIKPYLIPLNEFTKIFSKSNAKVIIFFIDSFHEEIELGIMDISAVKSWGTGKLQLSKERDIAFIFSCSAGEVSHFIAEPEAFGLFSRALAETISVDSPAKTYGEVTKEIQKRLNQLADKNGKPRQTIKIISESRSDEIPLSNRVILDKKSKLTVKLVEYVSPPPHGSVIMTSVEEDVIKMVGDYLGIPSFRLSLETTLVEDLRTHPVDLRELVVTVEDKFKIRIPNEEMISITRIQDIVDAVKRCLKYRKIE